MLTDVVCMVISEKRLGKAREGSEKGERMLGRRWGRLGSAGLLGGRAARIIILGLKNNHQGAF